jgi:hypothetical protein
MNICHGQCWYNQMVLVDPRDPARNTSGSAAIWPRRRPTNGGVSWTIKTWWLYSQVPDLPYAHADNHAAAFKLTGKQTVILGNDGGLNISEDNGARLAATRTTGWYPTCITRSPATRNSRTW